MTYNNPVFTEQCKLRKIEIDETGFVEQIPLDKKEKLLVKEIDEDEELDDNLDDNLDDETLFRKPSLNKSPVPSKPPVSKKPYIKDSLDEEKPKPKQPLNNLPDINDNNDDIAFKIGGSKSVVKAKPQITPMAPPPITDEELTALFGRKPTPSVRDRMKEELGDSTSDIKLNVDKTSSESSQSAKPRIKLNIKPKP